MLFIIVIKLLYLCLAYLVFIQFLNYLQGGMKLDDDDDDNDD